MRLEPQFAAIVESSNDGIVVTEPGPLEGSGPRVVYVNPAFERLTGWSRQEAIGRGLWSLQGWGSRRRMCEAYEQRLPIREELECTTRAGAELWVELNMVPLHDAAGQVTHFAAIQRDVTAGRRLEELAARDSLTGLHNRRAWTEQAEAAFARSHRHERPLAVALLDLDHFKAVNDTWGHAAGDAVLKTVAEACTAVVRTGDVVGRLGGEELGVVLPETPLKGASTLAVRLCHAIRSLRVPGPAGPLQVTVSIGVAERSAADTDLPALLARADAALYRAKRAGRDRVEVDWG